MGLELAAVQRALRDYGLDGWLLYDFHGSNPIAVRLAGLREGTMSTRRWYYLVPADGPPVGLVHAIEPRVLDGLPGERIQYAGRRQLDAGLTRLLAGMRRVAMEYSPACAIPYVSRVDAGTAEMVRTRGVEIVSSGDLVQEFEARWTDDQLATHQVAADALYRIKDRAFEAAARSLTGGPTLREYDLQQLMVRWFEEEGLVSDSAPVVAVGPHAGDPHYMPQAHGSAEIARDEVLLLDLWGKTRTPRAVFADITWMGVAAARVPDEVARVFAAAAEARDAAIALVRERAVGGGDLRGYEVDQAARAVLTGLGFGDAILHRTGHSLGEEVHGNGAHLDDYETHDDRRLLAGTGFTVEPGLYFEHFGVRTEINVYLGAAEATVTGPRQREVVTLG